MSRDIKIILDFPDESLDISDIDFIPNVGEFVIFGDKSYIVGGVTHILDDDKFNTTIFCYRKDKDED